MAGGCDSNPSNEEEQGGHGRSDEQPNCGGGTFCTMMYTKIDYPDLEETHQEKELLSGSPISDKMEKVSLVEDEDGGENTTGLAIFTGGDKNDQTKLENKGNDDVDDGDDDDDQEESGEDSSSEEQSDKSSSDESSSSSSRGSDDEEDNEEKGYEIAKLEEGQIEREEMIMDSDDEEAATKVPIKSKHEVEDLPPVPPVDISLEPHHKTMPVGVISSILGNRVIVEGSEIHSALNEGSILWITKTRSPLGIIDEIFGPVKNPYYLIRFNSEEEVPKCIGVGANVSFVSEFAEHILNQKDLYKKGYDKSGDNDEEIEDEVDFSDDEKEAEYRRSLRQQKRGTTHVDHDSGFGKRTNFNGTGFRKDKQPPMSPGTANPRSNVGPPTMMMQTRPQQLQAFQRGDGNGICDPSQQSNPLWPHGFPPRPQSMSTQGGFSMNSLPFLQLGQQTCDPQYQFQFHQSLNMFASGLMPYLQQQFLTNVGAPQSNMPWFGGPVNPLPDQTLPPVGIVGQGGVHQVPLECSNVNPQGEVWPPPVHSNHGRTFFHRSRPYQRGRHCYGGRGQQKNG